jgi:hypothetical protein
MGAKNKNKGGDRRPSGIGVSPQTKAQADYDKKTGFQTKGGGFLRDRFGNVVRSNVQVQRANQQKAIRDAIAQNIQAQEAKQVTPTQAGITSVMDRMKRDRQNLLDRAKRNRITNQQLNQLGKLNRDLGFNRTTGMGVIESLRDQFTKPEFKQGIGNLVKAYQRISPIGLLMRKILNPQFEEETGIQSLPEFKGLQRTNMMIGPGVYDFTQPTRMPSNMAGAIPGLSPPMQFADASRSDINTVLSPMFKGLDRDMIEALGGTFSPEFTDQDFEDIREGIITSPTGIYSAQI